METVEENETEAKTKDKLKEENEAKSKTTDNLSRASIR